MRKRNLLLSFSLLLSAYGFAANSPFTGAEAKEGTYYLYQVETGKWLQPNRTNIDVWTTHASLGDVGDDVQLKKIDGFSGYQIFCNFTANGELNGSDEDRFYLDQSDRDLTDWIFEPIDGTTNQYKIMVKAKPNASDRSRIAADTYIGADDNGELSDDPTNFTWQLVTREERIQMMIADAKKGSPADATFLIPWNDHGRNDMRDRLWKQDVVNNYGGAYGLGGKYGYPVTEAWHRMNVRNSITLTDMPTGTYNFTVQAYYRDTEIESTELRDRYVNHSENLVAKYFAGSAQGTVMSIFDNAKETNQDGYTYQVKLSDGEGDNVPSLWVPNSVDDACVAMFNGAYVNKWIQAPVTDGKLTIGIEKTDDSEAHHRDWLIFKRYYLQYVSETPIAEDLSGLTSELSGLIDSANKFALNSAMTEIVNKAKNDLANATSSSSLLEAISTMKDAVNTLNGAKDDINNYNATLSLAENEGVDVEEAKKQYDEATTRSNFSDALKTLRYARRRAHAEKVEDTFPGHALAAGKFYLYNIGQKQFLCGGSDWGAHAALGFPGVEITLEAEDGAAADNDKFHIDTKLYNGSDNHYLSYRGYMDGSKAGQWQFIPVAGKENVFNIVQADYPDAYVAWSPYASVDNVKGDETTVGTECRGMQPNNPDAQWKLVTRAEREAMLKDASLANPVDATFFIKSPNFNQREDANNQWELTNASIWEYGSCHNDFAVESYDSESASINQMVSNLPQGVYVVSVQGFYRNGNHADQPNLTLSQEADLYAGANIDDIVLLPNITSESGMAPGEGDNATSEDGTTYQYPNGIEQATAFFRYGLYRTHITILKDYDDDMAIGVEKNQKGEEGDWVVADNFRITYYGNNTTVEEVEKTIATGINEINIKPSVNTANGKVYNLQGVQVKNTKAPGIYIKNGKKIVVK